MIYGVVERMAGNTICLYLRRNNFKGEYYYFDYQYCFFVPKPVNGIYLSVVGNLRTPLNSKTNIMCMLDSIKTIFEILAYISAAIFFIFKAYSGAFYVSLSLNLNSDKRKRLNEQEDMLVIDMTLTGGENAMLDIYKIEGKIAYNTVENVFDFEGAQRLTVNNINNELEIIHPWTIYSADKYRISVKESTIFAKELIVPNNAICKIEIIVVGSRKNIFGGKPTISQWRASQISLPN
jgi:hypothetical protein